ncbi:MAG: DUF1800 family protein [Alphaproteobacteria bacterium]
MAATIQSFIAVTRFGLGAKDDEMAKTGRDPRDWLLGQLDNRHANNAAFKGLPNAMQAVKGMRERMQMKKLAKMNEGEQAEKFKSLLKDAGKGYIKDVAIRTRVATASQAPFFERLVHFWSNHFTVSATKPPELALAMAFEREAIRPHILGSFLDLLRASTRHPAMLIYLDNQRSIGPRSIAGRIANKGLNENLAREILELHTLGVSGGYTQKDVTEFAKILTGWSVDTDDKGDGSGFFFRKGIHEPGDKFVLGKTYGDYGVGEGEAALRNFAAHPSTAKFIATKIARHFIADEPSSASVNALAETFTRSNGNLMEIYKTLLSLEEAWQPLTKMKTPNDYILSMLRATGADELVNDMLLAGAYKMLGQAPFTAPSPAGWSDQAKDWVGAEALLQRIELAQKVSRGVHTHFDPAKLLEDTIGPVASAETKFAVTRAGSKAEALTLLFASPEFQRR